MLRLAFADVSDQDVYCVPTRRASLGEIADSIRRILPDADISFAPDAASFEQINRMDGGRFERDFGYTPPPLEDRIRHQINVARRAQQLPPLS